MSQIWEITRTAEPTKTYLAHQVITWSRYEKAALLCILLAAFAVYGVVILTFAIGR